MTIKSTAGDVPPEIEIAAAKRDAATEHVHCWHSRSDAEADNHEARCCQCGRRSDPTRLALGEEGGNG